MKDNFLNLIDQTESVESKFHGTSQSRGFAMPSLRIIHDVPEFQMWLQSLQMELQEIVDHTGDQFAADTLAVAKKNFDGWNDKKFFDEMKGKLFAMRDNIDKYFICPEKEADILNKKSPKIFISHSTKDKPYVEKLVALLENMGLDQTQLFCSSMPGYDIPVGRDIFDYLREQFLEYDLHIIFVHSPSYYQSAVSLNEMGAAWVLRSDHTSLLIPGFSFGQMVGVVGNNAIAIKLDNDRVEVKDKLNQLYARFVEVFGLRRKPDVVWEQKRDRFIDDVLSIVPNEAESIAEASDDDIEMLESGLLIRRSELATGKSISYCPACYTNYKKLFPIVKGSMARDRFCSNCKMRYSNR